MKFTFRFKQTIGIDLWVILCYNYDVRFTFRKFKYKDYNIHVLCINGKKLPVWFFYEYFNPYHITCYRFDKIDTTNLSVLKAKKLIAEEYCQYHEVPKIK